MKTSRAMFRAILTCVLVVGALSTSRESNAATVSLVGDVDCFGLGGSCPDGTLWRDELGGVFFTNYQGLGDPSFTDKWSTDISPSYTHAYLLGGAPVSATLEVRTAGLADDRGPWDVIFNGTVIGAFPTNTRANAFQEVLTHSFSVPIALLTGSDLVNLAINTTGQSDGYSIDFARLTIETTAVPEPASALLLACGALGVLARRRRMRVR